MVLTALSPSVVSYFVEERSDVFALSWLVGALLFLGAKRYAWSAIFLALSLLSKQTTWFIVPFFALYLWQQTAKTPFVFWRTLFIVGAVVAAVILPFLLWDARAFFDSVVLYLSGGTAQSYPISGYGLGMLLVDSGVILDIHAYYPFILWQLAVALPVLILLAVWLWRKPYPSRLVIAYAVFLAVYWYMSRYFNNSHLGYLSMLFVLGGLKYVDETHT